MAVVRVVFETTAKSVGATTVCLSVGTRLRLGLELGFLHCRGGWGGAGMRQL